MFNLHKNHLHIFVILLAFFISIAHLVALNFYLYFAFWWLDIIMHFLGGLLVALASLLAYITVRKIEKLSRRQATLIVLLGIIVVGTFWEVFEYFAGISLGSDFVIDTVTDAIMNLIGASVGLLYFNRTHKV